MNGFDGCIGARGFVGVVRRLGGLVGKGGL